MKTWVNLTCTEINPLSSLDDHLLKPMFKQRGFDFVDKVWDQEQDWSQFAGVIVRSTWDYAVQPQHFLQVLKNINQQTKLLNSYQTIAWNIDKRYLLELNQKGVPIIPTVYVGTSTRHTYQPQLKKLDAKLGLICKPVIGAGAKGLNFFGQEKELIDYLNAHSELELLIQPFIPSIQSQGEWSLIYFSAQYSHCILKIPKSGEIRCQEEYGSKIAAAEPPESMQLVAKQIFQNIGEVPLYARLDFMMDEKNNPMLVELELIEPALYLSYDSKAAQNFFTALAKDQF